MSRDEQEHEILSLIHAIDDFADAMKLKAIEKCIKDKRTGWDERENFAAMLVDMQKHAERGPFQALDIANYCCFLWTIMKRNNMDTKAVQELLDEHS